MINKKTKYALMALATLGERFDEKRPVLIAELAAKHSIPLKFLEGILLELKKRGFLLSKKGKGGGYLLAKAPEMLRLSALLRALEGPLAPLSCLSKTAHKKCDECVDEATCGIKMIMKEAYEAQINMLDNLTLQDQINLQALLNRSRDTAEAVPMYYI